MSTVKAETSGHQAQVGSRDASSMVAKNSCHQGWAGSRSVIKVAAMGSCHQGWAGASTHTRSTAFRPAAVSQSWSWFRSCPGMAKPAGGAGRPTQGPRRTRTVGVAAPLVALRFQGAAVITTRAAATAGSTKATSTPTNSEGHGGLAKGWPHGSLPWSLRARMPAPARVVTAFDNTALAASTLSAAALVSMMLAVQTLILIAPRPTADMITGWITLA